MRTPSVWGSVCAMRVLIVGCGYVGAALGAALVQSGHQVFGLRRRPEADAALTQMGLVPFHADFTREEELRRLPGPFDWVVNTAAPSEGDAAGYRRVYLEGTATLLRWLKDRPPQRYVYTSSTGVYGQNDGSVVTEESPTEPESETARVLVETERLLLAAAGERTPSNPVPGLDTQNRCCPHSPAHSPPGGEGGGDPGVGAPLIGGEAAEGVAAAFEAATAAALAARGPPPALSLSPPCTAGAGDATAPVDAPATGGVEASGSSAAAGGGSGDDAPTGGEGASRGASQGANDAAGAAGGRTDAAAASPCGDVRGEEDEWLPIVAVFEGNTFASNGRCVDGLFRFVFCPSLAPWAYVCRPPSPIHFSLNKGTRSAAHRWYHM